MRALVYTGAWNVGLREVAAPRIRKPHDVLVRIRASTICGTDIGIVSGLYDAKESVILGHEASGEVSEVGPEVTGFAVGDRVAIDPTFYCGRCWMCANGFPNHCEMKTTTETGVSSNGTFTDFYATEDRFLYKLADHVSFQEACLTEPLSCVMTGTNQLRLKTNLDTVVVGGGPIGMLYCHSLGLRGLSGAVVESSERRRELCSKLLPPQWIACASLEEAAKKLRTRTGDFDLIVDCCGVAAKESLGRLNRCGQLLLVGLRKHPVEFDPMRIADRSQRIVGSIDSIGTFSESLQLVTSGKVPAKRMVTAEYSLEEHREAFAALGCGIADHALSSASAAMKVVLKS